ncbi:hypothetical protein HMPREF7545_1697 [Selenomonas noxia ATCC 43541]|nr:hypothetical protein HMPREF7545_1697 [Selenomonas noxia ATCC 43541]DAS19372.1 MAG TPA: hypothetical protein [Caudoviricetes sp.]
MQIQRNSTPLKEAVKEWFQLKQMKGKLLKKQNRDNKDDATWISL